MEVELVVCLGCFCFRVGLYGISIFRFNFVYESIIVKIIEEVCWRIFYVIDIN